MGQSDLYFIELGRLFGPWHKICLPEAQLNCDESCDTLPLFLWLN